MYGIWANVGRAGRCNKSKGNGARWRLAARALELVDSSTCHRNIQSCAYIYRYTHKHTRPHSTCPKACSSLSMLPMHSWACLM